MVIYSHWLFSDWLISFGLLNNQFLLSHWEFKNPIDFILLIGWQKNMVIKWLCQESRVFGGAEWGRRLSRPLPMKGNLFIQ